MRAVAGLHLPAVQCLIEEIKVNLYTKGVFGFTVIDNLQALGDSDEAKAVKTYIQEIHDNGMRRVHDALVAKSAQDAITSVLPAPRKSAKPFLSNLPWGWLIGATVVTSLSIVTAASSSFRNSVFDFAKGLHPQQGLFSQMGLKKPKMADCVSQDFLQRITGGRKESTNFQKKMHSTLQIRFLLGVWIMQGIF